MKNTDYFKLLTTEIHSVVIATVDKNGLPSSRVIDIMLYDEKGIYFLTAKGKFFYDQLISKPYVSLCGITSGKNSMKRKSLCITGAVKNIGINKLDKIFEVNPYMKEIYPTPESLTALEVFCMYKGQGFYFDLSKKPIIREDFSFGGINLKKYGYQISDNCNSCGLCLTKCPQDCIETGKPFKIIQKNCLHCGNCMEICPVNAVLKLG